MIPLANPDFSGNELKYVTDCIESGWISSRGKYIKRFESMLTDWFGKQTMVCTSGTAALHMALLGCSVSGGEVIVPNLTYASTASAVLHAGAIPVLVDVASDMTMDPKRVLEAVTRRTRAIVPVQLYGNLVDPVILDMDIPVIVDACEAFDSPPVGDFCCYSFFANKHITTGEGGAVAASDLSLIRQIRDNPHVDYYHHLAGLNYRMTNLQAAVGCAQMERAVEFVEARLKCVEWYQEEIEGTGTWYFVAKVPNAVESLIDLKNEDIEAKRVFWPLNEQPPYRKRKVFPMASWWHEHGIVLPTGPHVTRKQVKRICRILKDRFAYSSDSIPVSRSPITYFNKVFS